jgi:phosphate transport system permease protein
LRAVPPSIREAALGVGASKMQSVFHHVLPLAAPGILTGTIIGLAQALGETAPLLLIGMVAFVARHPAAARGSLDPATALPVQIYMWTQRADPRLRGTHLGRDHRAAGLPDLHERDRRLLRKRFERRW